VVLLAALLFPTNNSVLCYLNVNSSFLNTDNLESVFWRRLVDSRTNLLLYPIIFMEELKKITAMWIVSL